MVLNPLTAIIAGAGGGLAAGAGGAVVNLALISYSAANTFINSYYFGYGMILGERDMYQNDWPKIQDRLEKGETFLRILEEKMREKTAAIMSLAGDIQLTVDTNYSAIMLQRLLEKPGEAFIAILNYLGLGGDTGADKEKDFIENEILPDIGPHSDVGKRPHIHGTGKGIPDILPGGVDEDVVPGKTPGDIDPRSTISNKNNPTWQKAIKLFNDAILKLYAHITAVGKNTALQVTQRNIVIASDRKKILLLSAQLAAFVKKYPSSSSNYPGP